MSDPQPAAPAPAPASNMQMPGFLARLGRAELFMVLGAAVIVLADLLFVVFGPYGFSNIAWAAAVLTVLLVFLGGRMLSFSAATHRSLLLLLGALVAVTFIHEVLDDIQFLSGANVAVTYYLGLLAFYAGCVLMIFGAWMLWGRKA